MNYDLLVECELRRFDWEKILESDGPAINIPGAIRELLASGSPQEAQQAYWKLENHVVVQGQVFEAAKFTVPAIMAALVDHNRASFVRAQLLELLFQIVNGVPHFEEVSRGMPELVNECQYSARQGVWILYRIFQEGNSWRAAKEIISKLDADGNRLQFLESLNAEAGRIDVPQKLRIET